MGEGAGLETDSEKVETNWYSIKEKNNAFDLSIKIDCSSLRVGNRHWKIRDESIFDKRKVENIAIDYQSIV